MPAIRGRDEHQNLEPALRFLQSHTAELAQARGAVHGSGPNQVGSDPAMAGSQSFYFALLLMPDAVPCGLSHTPSIGLSCRRVLRAGGGPWWPPRRARASTDCGLRDFP